MNRASRIGHRHIVEVASVTVGLAFLLLAFTAAYAKVTPSQKCQGTKHQIAGKYGACREKAEAALAANGDTGKYDTARDKCRSAFDAAWQKAEADAAKKGVACPSLNDKDAVRGVLDETTANVATGLAGSALLQHCGATLSMCSDDLQTCNADLSACNVGQGGSKLLATGRKIASLAELNDGLPLLLSVPDDGTLKLGEALAYHDNGDGTITDLNTGLMWEKKSDDGGLHDRDNEYAWSGEDNEEVETIWDWLADVNAEGGSGFAGYSDWRIPNIRELQSLEDYGQPEITSGFCAGGGAGSNDGTVCTDGSLCDGGCRDVGTTPLISQVFFDNCPPGCTVLTGSCTEFDGLYMSSTHRFPDNEENRDYSYHVSFEASGADDGAVDDGPVRAVRGGL